MAVSLSLSAYTRTHPGPAGWRRQPRPEARHTCDLRTEHHMVYASPDGRVFDVRRLRCDHCGRRYRDATRREAAPAVEAGF